MSNIRYQLALDSLTFLSVFFSAFVYPTDDCASRFTDDLFVLNLCKRTLSVFFSRSAVTYTPFSLTVPIDKLQKKNEMPFDV